MFRKKHKMHNRICFVVLSFMLILIMLMGLICGSVHIPFGDILNVVFGGDCSSKYAVIIRSVRLPRVLGGILAGAGLGTAGAILQGIMNNSLACPNTIGVNSGAGFGVMLSMMLMPHNFFANSIMAFLGAFLTSILILVLAYVAEKSRITIVLAGITISSFLSAGMNMLKILDTDISINATQFMIGSLSGVTMKSLLYPAMGITAGILSTIILSKALNILTLGDGVAASIGLRVNLFRIIFVVIASILAGLVVSFAGLVSFVGLIVPHICRYLFGQDAGILIPSSALLGSIFVLVADLSGRVLFSPFELPVGIILALAGGPFFLYLLMKKGGRRVNA